MPEFQKIKNGGLDQYGAERFNVRLIFATIRKSVGLKGLNRHYGRKNNGLFYHFTGAENNHRK